MKKPILFAIVSLFVTCLMAASYAYAQDYSIPKWIKNNAAWWAEGQIGDSDFLKGIQYLIEKKILRIPETKQSSDLNKQIPAWVKNNAKWWSEGKIGDSDFVSGIQYLVQNGIIVVQHQDSVVKQKEAPTIEDKQTVMKANTIFTQGEVIGCGRPADEQLYQYMTYYKVVNGNIELSENLPVPQELKKWQDDTEKHKRIWSHFSKIVPPKYLDDVSRFTIFTDGLEWLELDVQPNKETKKWDFVADIADWYCRGSLDEIGLKRYIIHELGHMITLDSSQIVVDYDLVDEWYFGDIGDYRKIFPEKIKNCKETFMTHSGCSKPDSYINKFVKDFQIKKLPDHINYKYPFYNAQWEDALRNLYTSDRSSYVTEYAASDPTEDMAESWTAFVLKEKPSPTTIADKKILFFYNFPELVEIRNFMRGNL